MLRGKKTRLFWCGLFILIIGILSLLGRVEGVVNFFLTYLHMLGTANQFPSMTSYWSNFWLPFIVTNIVWITIWSVLIAIGLYVMKSGVKKETVEPPSS
jgi:hypothetical protein